MFCFIPLKFLKKGIINYFRKVYKVHLHLIISFYLIIKILSETELKLKIIITSIFPYIAKT